MSSFIVDRETITILINAGIEYGTFPNLTEDSATAFGQALWDENIASVLHLYSSDTIETAPGPIGENFLYEYPGRRIDASNMALPLDHEEVVNACRSYRYQSCEHPGWEDSVAEEISTLLLITAEAEKEIAEKTRQAERVEDAKAAHAQDAINRTAFDLDLETRKPEWAVAAIVAKYVEDMSDMSTDYFGGKTTKRLILAWSKHTRDLFSEMRKAAENAEETKHLGRGKGQFIPKVVFGENCTDHGMHFRAGDYSPWHNELHGGRAPLEGQTFETLREAEEYMKAKGEPETISGMRFEWDIREEEIEHREKYSMGHGYYLKAGHRYSTGWEIHKTSLSNLYPAEYRIPVKGKPAKSVAIPRDDTPEQKPHVRKSQKEGWVCITFRRSPSQQTLQRLEDAGFLWEDALQAWHGKASTLGLKIFI